jgi:hypothetical protein
VLKISCVHGADKPNHSCRACWFIHGRPGGIPQKWGIFCVHGTQASRCRCALVFFDLLCSYMKHHRYPTPCGGTGRCEHGALTFQCLQCAHGSRVCQHGYFKDRCVIDPCPKIRSGKEALQSNPTTEAGFSSESVSPASGASEVASLPGNSWYAVYAMYAMYATVVPNLSTSSNSTWQTRRHYCESFCISNNNKKWRYAFSVYAITHGMLCMLCMLCMLP